MVSSPWVAPKKAPSRLSSGFDVSIGFESAKRGDKTQVNCGFIIGPPASAELTVATKDRLWQYQAGQNSRAWKQVFTTPARTKSAAHLFPNCLSDFHPGGFWYLYKLRSSMTV
jgi:hypothetical protein